MIMRDEQADDADALRTLIAAAFTTGDHDGHAESAILDGLRDNDALTLSLVAEADGAVVGHVAFSAVTIEGATGWFGLAPVSVLPAHQGRGIGAALIREGVARLRAMGASGCVVLGEPAYYGRFGFANDPALHYGEIPPPWLQRLVLAGSEPKGNVAFHAVFGGH